MTDQENTNSNDPNKGKIKMVDARPHAAPKTRSLSLKDALAALGEAGKDDISQNDAVSGVESIMSRRDNHRMEGSDIGEGDAPDPRPQSETSSEDGKPKTKIFGGSSDELKYHQEPVAGWLVVIAGPGIGAYRPIFVGSNTIGSDPGQRIPIDFGDEYISKEEQAYIRYDADDRQFLFIPNLAKTNVVSIDNVKPTSAVRLSPYDIITMGDTQLVFIPFCGDEFDWTDLPVKQK